MGVAPSSRDRSTQLGNESGGQTCVFALTPQDVQTFNEVAIGMDWLTFCFAKVDCYSKLVKFKFLWESSFVIYEHGSPMSVEVVSDVAIRPMPRQKGQRYLVMARDDSMGEKSVEAVSVVGEYLDVFFDELLELPSKREIEFCIDLILGTQPIFIPLYQMAQVKLRELKRQLEDLLDKGFIYPNVSA
ncbi:uncharacterized protein LOC110412278 [Herrania umbratica]|uniref:Uncharacterized protein LOC110412278 n=1 Tax=Herrania umbratica TaxID=108875 RepID=A0A6J0ZV81_9ROSI|nr:uncharacterized protein LOC110412278 [Herrania umbratica]